MHRATKKASAGCVLGAAMFVAGSAFLAGGAHASTTGDAPGRFSPGLGCETVSDTPVGTKDLLARVRADTAPKRRAGEATRRQHRRSDRIAARPAPRSAERAAKLPRVAQEARPALLRSFYTCDAATSPDPAEGTGWRLVGPLRQG